jgi:hypothetical protein
MNTFTPVRPPVSLLKKAVLLNLEMNWSIKTLELPLNHVRNMEYMQRMAANSYPDYYIIRDKKSEQIIFKIEIYLSNIEFSEYNPYNTQWSTFHTFVCQQYPIDSKEDQLQIEYLDKLIAKFIRERDRTNYDDFESKLSDSAYKSLFEKDVGRF